MSYSFNFQGYRVSRERFWQLASIKTLEKLDVELEKERKKNGS
jgi:hypothetical protein